MTDTQFAISALDDYLAGGNTKAYIDLPEVTLLPAGSLSLLAHVPVTSGRKIHMIDSDTVQHVESVAESRGGEVAIIHYSAPGSDYHWLQLSARPFIPGDRCDGTRDAEALYVLGQFLRHCLEHPDRYPLMPKTYTAMTRCVYEAESWRTSISPSRQHRELEAARALQEGIRILDPHALDGIGASPEALTRFDPDWPPEQIQQLLYSLYDMNHRSLVNWVDERLTQDAMEKRA